MYLHIDMMVFHWVNSQRKIQRKTPVIQTFYVKLQKGQGQLFYQQISSSQMFSCEFSDFWKRALKKHSGRLFSPKLFSRQILCYIAESEYYNILYCVMSTICGVIP